jgi:hypothetical protein
VSSVQAREPTSKLEALSCSSYEFACVHTSPSQCVRFSACLCGFQWIGGVGLSIACQCVSARLQYGLQYMSGRDEVMRQWSMLKIPYIDPTPQHIGVCHRMWMR